MGFPSPIAPVKNHGQETCFFLENLEGFLFSGLELLGLKEGSFSHLQVASFCAASQCSMHCINPRGRLKGTT